MRFMLLLSLLSSVAFADPIIRVSELYTEVQSYECGKCGRRHPFLELDDKVTYGLSHYTGLSLLEDTIIDDVGINVANKFFLEGYSGVKYAGLEYNLGIEYYSNRKRTSFEFGYFHHSSHALDKTVRDGKYPLTDALYLRINWVKK